MDCKAFFFFFVVVETRTAVTVSGKPCELTERETLFFLLCLAVLFSADLLPAQL